MNPIPSEAPSVEPGWDEWTPERPDMEWAIAELAAWAAILSARAGTRGRNAASSAEV